jgi:penicillin-binding protein 1A
MTRSVNVVFTQLICKIGPEKVVKVYKDLHFSQPINSDAAIALGGLEKGVSPLEMAAAYATFAAKGVYAYPYTINRILDRNGKVIYQHKVKTEKVFEPNQAGVLTKALEGVVNGGTGTAANFGRPLAGKTGTTENFGNAWFVGYTPQLATAVWVGHMEGDIPMLRVHGGSVQGGRFPAQIFSATMKVALQGQPVLPLFEAGPDSLNLHPATPPAQPSDAPRVQTAPPSTTSSTNPGDTTTSTDNPSDTTTSTTTFQQQSTTTSSSSTTTSTTARKSSTSSSTTSSSTSTTQATVQQQSATSTTSTTAA